MRVHTRPRRAPRRVRVRTERTPPAKHALHLVERLRLHAHVEQALYERHVASARRSMRARTVPRAQLRAWHGACAHAAPRAGDVALVQRLLDVCVQAQALDKVQGVLGWWRALCADAHPAWRAAWARVHAHVQAHMSAQYGATLAG